MSADEWKLLFCLAAGAFFGLWWNSFAAAGFATLVIILWQWSRETTWRR